MSAGLVEAICHEHNAAIEAAPRAQARALHLSVFLLVVCRSIGFESCKLWHEVEGDTDSLLVPVEGDRTVIEIRGEQD